MNTSLLSQMTLIHFAPCAAASTTCRGMIGSISLWIVSRYLLSMTIYLKIFTGIEAGPVTSRSAVCYMLRTEQHVGLVVDYNDQLMASASLQHCL